MCDLFQIFGARCLRSWLDRHTAKGAKSAIYNCLVLCCCIFCYGCVFAFVVLDLVFQY